LQLFVFLDKGIYESLFFPFILTFTMFHMLFCPSIIRKLFAGEEGLIFVNKKRHAHLEQFSTSTLKKSFGLTSLVGIPFALHLICINYPSNLKLLVVLPACMHFAPVFLQEKNKLTFIEWLLIFLSINAGFVFTTDFWNSMTINIAMLIYVVALRNSNKYFRSLQIWMFLSLANNICILNIESPKAFLEFWNSHLFGMTLYHLITLLLTIALFTPPKIIIKMANLYKVVYR